MGFGGLFSSESSNNISNTTNNLSNSYNTTNSSSHVTSDSGNITISVDKANTATSILPIVVVAVAGLGLLAVLRE
jgi:hypothetical protein